MSIIVVVKKNGKAVIAADTHYSFGTLIVKSEYLSNRTKIHPFDDSFIGTVGATAHENVLEHLFEKHKSKLAFGSKKDIFDTYLRLHPILKDEYFMNTSQGEDDEDYESSQIDALIANSNGIFGIYSWREVYEFEKFWALGSGRDYALGALFANYDSFDEPEQIAQTAVQAACEFDEGCGLPMTFHSIKLAEKK
jgi:ATP-dependent protease HslVU (ClpYQ) peptidase subunit